MKTILLTLTLISIGLTPQLRAQTNANVPTQHNEATVDQLQAEMALGKLTSVQLTNYYIARINALDQRAPTTASTQSSSSTLTPSHWPNAQTTCASRARCWPAAWHSSPPKDNIDTRDKMQTTAGSFALFGRPALQDSTVAANLRAGGAVILGKINL